MQIHQHFFCVRMDTAVDDASGGQHLTVTEVCFCIIMDRASALHIACSCHHSAQVNVASDPEGPANPFNVGFNATETPLTSELRAKRRVNTETSRIWKVVNHSSRNAVTGGRCCMRFLQASRQATADCSIPAAYG